MTRCTHPQALKIDRNLLVNAADALWLLHQFTHHAESIAESVCTLLEHNETSKALRLAKSLAELAEQAANSTGHVLSVDITEAIPVQKGGAV